MNHFGDGRAHAARVIHTLDGLLRIADLPLERVAMGPICDGAAESWRLVLRSTQTMTLRAYGEGSGRIRMLIDAGHPEETFEALRASGHDVGWHGRGGVVIHIDSLTPLAAAAVIEQAITCSRAVDLDREDDEAA